MAKNKSQVLRKDESGFIAKNWEGSLPHPEDLQKYEALCPGATDRLLRVIETEQSNVYELNLKFLAIQDKAVDKGASQAHWWQFIVLVIALVPIFASIKIAEFDLWLARIAGFGGIISAFFVVYQNFKKK